MKLVYYTKTLESNSPVQAEFGIHIPEWGMTLNKLKLLRSKNGHLYVAAPSMKRNDQFVPMWDFDMDRKKRFFDAALKLVQEHIDKSGGSDMAPAREEMLF